MSFWRDQEEVAASRGPNVQVNVPPRQNVQTAVDEAYNRLQDNDAEAAAEVEEEVRTLSEVERRLRKSNCYRAILDQPLFDENASEEAVEVEAEFREFALARLRELMGISAIKPPVEQQFSYEEEVALKAWAAKLVGKPAILSIDPGPAKPAVSSVKTPAAVPLSPAPIEPRLRTMSDPVRAPRKPSGRPPHAKNKPKAEVVTPAPPLKTAEVVEVERVGADGKVMKVAVNNQKQVEPTGAVRVPMPSPDMALSLERTKSESIAMNHPVLQQFINRGE